MGQYYKIINLDKKEYLHPHAFGNGLKLLEFGCSADGVLTGLAILLADGNGRGNGDLDTVTYRGGAFKPKKYQRVEYEWELDGKKHRIIVPKIVGSWAGDKVVISGDYSDKGKFIPEDRKFTEKEREMLLNYYTEVYCRNLEGTKDINLYTYASLFFKEISAKVLEAMKDDYYLKEVIEEKEKNSYLMKAHNEDTRK